MATKRLQVWKVALVTAEALASAHPLSLQILLSGAVMR